jgi:hypothetical protein
LNTQEIAKIEEPNIYKVVIKGGTNPKIALDIFNFFQQLPELNEIRLLTVITEFKGFKEIKDFLQGINADEIKVKRLTKNAIVSESRWVEKIIKMEDQLISKTNIKFFKEHQQQEAINWLKKEK